MNIEHRLYPYPVLSYFSDDYVNSTFEFTLGVEQKKENIVFNLFSTTNDKGLLNLINQGLAEYIFHIECPTTTFREFISSQSGIETKIVPESLLNNKVNICSFIVAKKDINEYTNRNFNIDYENISFSIEKSNILAIAKQFNVEIEKEKDNLGQTPSIFLILKRANDNRLGMEIDMMQNKIEISLSKSDYENYSLLASGKYQSILHSSIIFPALIYVFENLKTSDLDTLEDRDWFKTIKKVLMNLGIDLDKEALDNQLSYELAQKIINFPVSRMLVSLINEEFFEEEIE